MSLSNNPIEECSPSIWLDTDASNLGWGAVRDSVTTGGRWTFAEQNLHINVLELKTALFGLQSLCRSVNSKHIRIRIDNVTAVSYINKMGGTKSNRGNCISNSIWKSAISSKNFITAEHLAGSENFLADKASRVFHDFTEWQLNQNCFNTIVKLFGTPEIDLFASHLNFKCNLYVSWQPDPNALYIDAFSRSWGGFKFYAFPPFSLIGNCLK